MGEFFGYLASLLVFMTFYMKTMVPLRIVAILSNVAFLGYAIIENLVPVVILHGLLLPLNFLRLKQVRSRIAAVRRRWSGDISVEDLLPFMDQVSFQSGEILFRKGDASHEMYFILDGAVHLEEIRKSVGPGELFGEMSMFAPDRRRTATAVCEADTTLLRLSDSKVLELYDQDPDFGFYLVRLITGRLLENQTALEELAAGRPAAMSSEEAPPHLGTSRRTSQPSPGRIKRLRVATSPYFLGATVIAVAAVIYLGWLITPYMESVFFRDAAVTTWLNAARSPIKGNLDGSPLTPGQRVGADGRIVNVRNEQADHTEVERTGADIVRAEAKVAELENYLAQIRALEAEFVARSAHYAEDFKKMLSIEIGGWKRELVHLDQQLRVTRVLTERKVSLAQRGTASRTAADEARAEQAALARTRAERQRAVEHAQQRLKAAENEVYLTGDGRVPEWAYRSDDALRIEVKRAAVALANAKSELARARVTAEAATRSFEDTSASTITAPPGSVVWSVFADKGEAVEVGSKVVEWIDCSVILVDVPSSDVELSLLRPGMPADAVFEGETRARSAKVLMTRGAASTLGVGNLAAVAKGRDPGEGQVILTVDSTLDDRKDCPVGRAAAVDFPTVDTLDLIRARLRL